VVLDTWKAVHGLDVSLSSLKQLLSVSHLDPSATQPCYTPEDWAASLFRLSLCSSPRQSSFQQDLTLLSSRKLQQGNKVLLPTSFLRVLTRNGEDSLPSPLVLELRVAQVFFFKFLKQRFYFFIQGDYVCGCLGVFCLRGSM
jgi:hypothetical protein